MRREKIVDVLQSKELDREVKVCGLVRSFRNDRFIALNDGSALGNVQVVIDADNYSEEILKSITIGAALGITGTLIESQGKGQSVEILASAVEIIGPANSEEVSKTILQPITGTKTYLKFASRYFRTKKCFKSSSKL